MVGTNVQSAVDTETHIIVTHEVTNRGFDRDLLSPMSIAAKDALGRDDLHAIADKGYFSGSEILACHEEGITTTVPRPATSGNAAKGMYVKADFTYDAGRDVYFCPACEDLTYRYTTEERGIQLRPYWVTACQTCPLQSKCTTGTERRITRWKHEHLFDDMGNRLGRDPDAVTLRRCTVEQPFGTKPCKAWQSLDVPHPFPDPEAEECAQRDGAQRAGLQHQADGCSDRHPSAHAGDPGLILAINSKKRRRNSLYCPLASIIDSVGPNWRHSRPPHQNCTATCRAAEVPHSLGRFVPCRAEYPCLRRVIGKTVGLRKRDIVMSARSLLCVGSVWALVFLGPAPVVLTLFDGLALGVAWADDDGGDDGGDDDDDSRSGARSDRDRSEPQIRRVQPRNANTRRQPTAPVLALPQFAPEIVVSDLSEADLALLVAEGSALIERRSVSTLALTLDRLSAPAGVSLEAARDRIRLLATGTDADLNHFYRTSQAEPVALADAACSHENCPAFEAINWPTAAIEAGQCPVTPPIGLIDTGIKPDHDSLDAAPLDLLVRPGSVTPSEGGAWHGGGVAFAGQSAIARSGVAARRPSAGGGCVHPCGRGRAGGCRVVGRRA
jgi:hypothetical protein